MQCTSKHDATQTTATEMVLLGALATKYRHSAWPQPQPCNLNSNINSVRVGSSACYNHASSPGTISARWSSTVQDEKGCSESHYSATSNATIVAEFCQVLHRRYALYTFRTQQSYTANLLDIEPNTINPEPVVDLCKFFLTLLTALCHFPEFGFPSPLINFSTSSIGMLQCSTLFALRCGCPGNGGNWTSTSFQRSNSKLVVKSGTS